MLEPLYAAYAALKRARDERAPLDLDLPERKILLEPDGTVDRVVVPPRLDAHRLIEEFMILANVAAAETLERAALPLIYRVHDEPGAEKLNALARIPRLARHHLAKGQVLRPAQFNGILDARRRARDTEISSTRWCCAPRRRPNMRADNYGHFGLNLRRYAHFTSPIRRYADLIVHRALIRALELGDGRPADSDDARRARRDRASASRPPSGAPWRPSARPIDRLIAAHPADRIGADLRGPHLRRHPRRPVRELERHRRRRLHPGARSATSISASTQAGTRRRRRPGESFRLGDLVTVKLVEAAPVAGALRFELISEGRQDGPVRHSKRDARPARGASARPARTDRKRGGGKRRR